MADRKESALSAEELRLFEDRIARGLRERPLRIDAPVHRAEVSGLVGRVGEASFYELLGIGPGASTQEIHDAYERLARLVHPRHAAELGLAGKEGVLRLLFERATEAYLTLSHPDRRKRYDRELGGRQWSGETAGDAREEEGQQVARRYFRKAQVLAASEEYHLGIELMRQAVRIDPRGEYYAFLGQLLAKNPLWLRYAAENLDRAIELGASDPGIVAARDAVHAQMAADQAKGAETAPASGKRRFFGRG
jgi:curved DNA-binding protein CbpA